MIYFPLTSLSFAVKQVNNRNNNCCGRFDYKRLDYVDWMITYNAENNISAFWIIWL